MKDRKTFLFWSVEFGAIVAIGLIPSLNGVSLWWLGAPIGVILVSKFAEYHATVRDAHKRVREQLEILLALIPHPLGRIRCTYHIPTGVFRKRLMQACDYLPDGGGANRKFSTQKGIIGLAYKEKTPLVENFKSDDEYRTQMKMKYNYTTDEVAKRSADRRSYFCYPIADENHEVLGLVYFDSDVEGEFSSGPNADAVVMIRTACGVISNHLL
jgi:hypothetical protein